PTSGTNRGRSANWPRVRALQLPGDGRWWAGIVDAAVAGLDRSREMATQRSVARTDLGNRSLDCLRDHQPSPFGVGSGLPVSSTPPYRGDDLIAKNFQLRAKVRSPLPIVELNGFCELLAQLADAAAVLLPGLGVEQRARIAEVCGRAARFDRQT